MLNNLYSRVLHLDDYKFNPVVMMLKPIETAVDNQIVRRSEFVPFDISEALCGFNSVDFSISSQIAVGALSTLKSTYMSSTSSLNVADSFDNVNISIDVK